MALLVEWVPYGRAAADRLRLLISEAKGGEPLEPVTVVVPSNHVGVASRRLLAGGALGPVCDKGSGIAAVTFLTPYRLAELLGAARLAGLGRRPVSTPVIAAALRAVLAEEPGVFGSVAAHPATETALVGAFRELRDCSKKALEGLHRCVRTRSVGFRELAGQSPSASGGPNRCGSHNGYHVYRPRGAGVAR